MSARERAKLRSAPLAVLVALLLCSGSVHAQQGPPPATSAELYVKVSARSGGPLQGVKVTVSTSTTNRVRSTNAEGLARFTDLPPGVATVQALLDGWDPAGTRTTLSAGNRREITLPLDKRPAPARPPEAPESPSPSSTTAPPPTAREP